MPRLADPPVDKSDTNARATAKPRRDWKPTFLEAYRNRGTVKAACKIAGISRQRAYKVRAADPEFAAAWAEAEERTTELLEETAYERALNGSDRLAEFLLKARRPKKYREAGGRGAGVEAATEEIEQGVNETIERQAAEIERLTDRLADVASNGEAEVPGDPAPGNLASAG